MEKGTHSTTTILENHFFENFYEIHFMHWRNVVALSSLDYLQEADRQMRNHSLLIHN